MRTLLFFLLLCGVTFAAETPQTENGDLPPVLQNAGSADPVPELSKDTDVFESLGVSRNTSHDLEKRIEYLERYARENSTFLYRMVDKVEKIEKDVEQIKREIAKLTIKKADGTTTTQNIAVPTTAKSEPFVLPPGAVITHIDGVPVNQSTYYNPVVSRPVTQYATPRMSIRSYPASSGRVISYPRMMSGGNCVGGSCSTGMRSGGFCSGGTCF